MRTPKLEEVSSRVRDWATDDPLVSAVILYGSAARGQDDDRSDLDLLIVAEPGRREELWQSRHVTTERILGTAPAWTQEPSWQREFRFQAWRTDLTAVDLTYDEGTAHPWLGLASGFIALVDKRAITQTLRARLATWSPPEHDAESVNGTTWMWLRYLSGCLRHGHTWMVRCGLTTLADQRVAPLYGAGGQTVDTRIDDETRHLFDDALPTSSEPAELARSVHAVGVLYDAGLDVWARRTGRERPTHPFAAAVLDQLGADLPGGQR